jgi:hypothetical protein
MSPRGSINMPRGSVNIPEDNTTAAFIISKEKVDIELAYELKAAGKITTPGKLFKISDKTEIDALIINSVFRFE